jgi:CRISPR/Cas system-associated endonuclease Cas1
LAVAERRAALAYWKAWRDVQIRFVKADIDKLPEHWLTFGQRRSTQSTSGHRAISPVNAILNYLYSLLEAEARIASISVGLDPGLGFLHADTTSRDSLALDLMEAGRPAVDRYVLDLIEGHVFRASDFTETRLGLCRVGPRLAHHLSATTVRWAEHLAKPAEDIAQLLINHRVATPLTQSNKRAAKGRSWAPSEVSLDGLDKVCEQCGETSVHRGKLCAGCWKLFQRDAQWASVGRQRLAVGRLAGSDPAHGGAAGEQRAAKVSIENRRSRQWNRDHADRPDPELFVAQIAPALADVTLRAMSEATGLSTDYCSKIRRGLKVPHPRHWEALQDLGFRAAK